MARLIFAWATMFALTPLAFGNNFSEQRVAAGKMNGVEFHIGPIEPNVTPNPTPSITPSPTPSIPDTTPVTTTTPPAKPDTVASDSQGTVAGLYAALSAMLFGKDRSILEAQAGMSDALDGESDFYWGGFKVWNSKPQWKDGAFQIAAGLPTVTMRAPLVRVPVGPVTLAVDAGVAAEASVTAKLAPLISIPVQFSSVKATLETDISASGFIEGYAKWLIVRAGVGGELKLIRTDAKVSGQVGFSGVPPRFNFEGFISLLSGKIYGFVDYFNLLGFKWKRALEPVIATWKGKCVTLSLTAGGADPCATSVP